MERTLIIKTGAAGDVVRTTPLLRVLKGEIFWVTAADCIPLLPEHLPQLVAVTIEEAKQRLSGLRFDRILSLEEEPVCAKLAGQWPAGQLTGIYIDEDDCLSYTDDSAHWFEMSRISRLGLARANALKKQNLQSWQEHLFRMLDLQFQQQPYCIYQPAVSGSMVAAIGMETRTGKQWPNKQWSGYASLAARLSGKGWKVFPFSQQVLLRDYLGMIAGCRHVVSGDTLAMHVAMAYGISCTAIFNCTSPAEIEGYGLLRKAVSPLLHEYFYKTSYDPALIGSVGVEEVVELVSSALE